jgi:hypothetical protein
MSAVRMGLRPPETGGDAFHTARQFIIRSAMTEGDPDRLDRRVADLDDIIRRAREDQYTDMPTEIASLFLRDDPILRWDLCEFVAAHEAGRCYPADRLPKAVDRLIDGKLQFYFVAHVLPATQNVMVYNRGFDPARPLDTPALQLARLCYTQAMIGQSRILWEGLMRLIYYLEEGSDPTGKSTRRPFRRKLKDWSPRWDVLAEWQPELDRYSDRYRTPEYHSGSVLKRELLGGPAVDPNDVLSLLTPVMNGIWPVLIANVRGEPHHIVRLGRKVRPGE